MATPREGKHAAENSNWTPPEGSTWDDYDWDDVKWEELPEDFRRNYPESAENDPECSMEFLPSFGWWPGFKALTIGWNRKLKHITIEWGHPTEYVLHDWQWREDDRHEGGGYWEFWDHRARWFGDDPEDPRLQPGKTE